MITASKYGNPSSWLLTWNLSSYDKGNVYLKMLQIQNERLKYTVNLAAPSTLSSPSQPGRAFEADSIDAAD